DPAQRLRMRAPDGAGVLRRRKDAGAMPHERVGLLHARRARDDGGQQIVSPIVFLTAHVRRQPRQDPGDPRAVAEGDDAGEVGTDYGRVKVNGKVLRTGVLVPSVDDIWTVISR